MQQHTVVPCGICSTSAAVALQSQSAVDMVVDVKSGAAGSVYDCFSAVVFARLLRPACVVWADREPDNKISNRLGQLV
jgi:hypothetical protein